MAVKYVSDSNLNSVIQEVKTRLATKERIIQFSTMPTLTSANAGDYAGMLAQYVGTTGDYVQGDFYVVDTSGTDPAWVKVTYSKAEVDALVAARTSIKVVSELPTSNIDVNALYLIPAWEYKDVYVDSTNSKAYIKTADSPLTYAKFDSTDGSYEADVTGADATAVESAISAGTYAAQNMLVEYGAVDGTKDEYVCIDATSSPVKWEKVGSTQVDLSGYVKSSDLVAVTSGEITAMWNGTY